MAGVAVTGRARLWHWRRVRGSGRAVDVPAMAPVPIGVPRPAEVQGWGTPGASAAIAGAVEAIIPSGRVRGWARADEGGQGITIHVVAGGQEIGTGVPARPRPDVGGPHGFDVACERAVAAADFVLGRAAVVAVAQGGAAKALRLTGNALRDGLLDIARTATGDLAAAEVEALIAGLQAHPALRRRSRPEGDDGVSREAAAMAAMLDKLPPNPADPGRTPATWHIQPQPGMVSPDGSAVLGHGGHHFLVGGSNVVLAQYLADPAREDVGATGRGWHRLVQARAAVCARHGSRYLQIFIPEKLSVMADRMPRTIPVPTPYWRAAETAIAADPALNGICLFALALLTRPFLREQAYARSDTHLTARAAYHVFAAACAAMRIPVPFPEAPFTREAPGHGDLAGRMVPGFIAPETFMLPMAELEALWPTPELVEEVAARSHNGSHIGSHIGRRLVWRTLAAPVRAKVVVFGNSFFESGASARALSWWFARAFAEFHFCWSAEMDEAYLRAHRPDWVICQTVERFLPMVPPA